jgi:peptidyl-tRNA hydrolase
MTGRVLKVSYSVTSNVNLRFYQNAVTFLRELTLMNASGKNLADVSIKLTAEPSVLDASDMARRPGRERVVASHRSTRPGARSSRSRQGHRRETGIFA